MGKWLNNKLLVVALTFVLLLSVAPTAYSQCAMCRATVESNTGTGRTDDSNNVGSGLNTGILYLMAIPYILIGTVGFLWYRSNKKHKAKAAQL